MLLSIFWGLKDIKELRKDSHCHISTHSGSQHSKSVKINLSEKRQKSQVYI